MIAEGTRMPRQILFVTCLLLTFVLAGCDAPSPTAATPSRHSMYSLDRVFKDPRAQALALAAEQGNVLEVQRLMKQEHVNPDVIFSDDDSGMPLVAWPVFTLNPTGLKAMLDNGANPNARKPGQHTKTYEDGSGGTYFDYDNAMVWAAKQEDPIYLKLLLDHGGDPNTRNGNDESLLFQAYIWHNQWRNVKLLVERGAHINDMTQSGTILYDYSSMGEFEEAYWLLQHGADPTVRDPLIQSLFPAPPRYLAVEDIFWHPTNPSDPSWQRKCQQWLLQHGFKRPPLPEAYRDLRKTFGLPYEEKDIPLL
ncbi:MAG TPA: ankyrin repeat domain-containing protein [Terriglobales bacterium]